MSQEQKVIEMLSDGEWHCQLEFRQAFMWSPHKRREEAEKSSKRSIEFRACTHGLKRSRDYRFKPVVTTLF
jgi:hypothetical protein